MSGISLPNPSNGKVTLFSFAWFFCILGGYYIIRPIRETMGVASGRESLNWLFLATFITMILVVPIYSACVARLSRRWVVAIVYRFFIVNILVFWWLLQIDEPEIRLWVARAFFVWVSVFSLYATSVFWSVLADLFTSSEAKRSFGVVAAGGTTGAIAGSAIAGLLAERLSTHNLLLIPAVLLEVGLWFAIAVQRQTKDAERLPEKSDGSAVQQGTGGGLLDGIVGVAKSPYLIAVCVSLFLGQLCGTQIYMQQASIVESAIADESKRTTLFSNMNLATQVLTLVLQASSATWLKSRFGLAVALSATPIAYAITFGFLGVTPSLMVFAIGDVFRRGLTYGVLVPAREVLFTVVSREDKYKSKGFIDTVILRGGDAISSQFLALAKYVFASPLALQIMMVPIAGTWIGVSLLLARWQRALARKDVPNQG